MPGTKQTHLVQSIHAWDKAYTLDWDKANTPGAKQTHLGLGRSKHTWDWDKANTPGTKQAHLGLEKSIHTRDKANTPGKKHPCHTKRTKGQVQTEGERGAAVISIVTFCITPAFLLGVLLQLISRHCKNLTQVLYKHGTVSQGVGTCTSTHACLVTKGQ